MAQKAEMVLLAPKIIVCVSAPGQSLGAAPGLQSPQKSHSGVAKQSPSLDNGTYLRGGWRGRALPR